MNDWKGPALPPTLVMYPEVALHAVAFTPASYWNKHNEKSDCHIPSLKNIVENTKLDNALEPLSAVVSSKTAFNSKSWKPIM